MSNINNNYEEGVRRSREMYEAYHDIVYNKFKGKVKDRRYLKSKEYDEIFHEISDQVPDCMTYIINAIILNHGWMVYYKQKGDDLMWYYELVNETRI